MFSARRLMYRLLLPGVPKGVELYPQVYADGVDALPFVTYSTSCGAALSRSLPIPRAWDASTVLSVFAETEEEAEAICSALYAHIHSFDDPFLAPLTGVVEDYGHVNEVEDRDGFDLVTSVSIDARRTVQYSGSFSHQVHQD